MKKEQFEQVLEQLFQPMIEKCISKALEENKDSTVKNPEQWLTITQACKEFGCTQHTLRKALLKSELSYYQPDKHTYIKRIDVYRYMETLRIRSKDDRDG